MSDRTLTQTKTASTPTFTPVNSGVLQRKCDCGNHTVAGGECAECGKKGGTSLQRSAVSNQPMNGVPPIVHDVLSSPGQPMDAGTRAFMEPRFRHDFSQVRVHTGSQAAESARAVHAHAYTVGSNVVFNDGKYEPQSEAGQRLLVHELTHVVQQSVGSPTLLTKLEIGEVNSPAEQEADRAASFAEFQPSISKASAGAGIVLARAPASKAPAIGSKFVHPAGATSTYKSVKAEFDGQDFIVYDGATSIMTHAGQSGKPISVRTVDANACGGSTADSYTNNPRYVGIQDFGGIPEGDFTVSLSEFSTFNVWEQAQMIQGGMFTDPFGSALHGGDWGYGRAPLRPKTLLPGPAGCGDTQKRSGFYLHGGSLPGSSGCIDVDNSGIKSFLSLLAGYKAVIPVKVHYTHAAPTIGAGTRGVGRFTYPTKDGKPIKDPSIWDRLKAIGDSDDLAPRETPKQEPKPPLKPKTTPKPKKKPRSGKKGTGKRSDLLSPGNEELLAGEGQDDDDLRDSLFDDDEESENALV